MTPSPLATAFCTLLLAALVASASQSKFPKTWKICRRSDPQMNACLRNAVEQAVLSLKDGFPSLGVLPVDPFHFDKLELADSKGGTGPVSIKLLFSNLDLIGISTVSVEKFKVDWDAGTMEGYVTFGKPVQLIGDYVVDGKVLLLPVTGKGKCKLSFDNFTVALKMNMKEYTKNKKRHLDATKMTVDIDTTRFHMYLENLFNGDKALGDQMNIFINENWEEILKELKPSISRNFGEAFRQVANRIFSKLSLDEISPP